MDEQNPNYSNEYSENSFWEKVKNFASSAGKEVIEKALTLYYCLGDKDTPVWAKGIIVATLGYFIVPLDAIPDITPFVGYADDLGALIAASTAVLTHIKDEHVNKAKEQLNKWFGNGNQLN